VTLLPNAEGPFEAKAWIGSNDTTATRFAIDLTARITAQRPQPSALLNVTSLDFGTGLNAGGRAEQTFHVANVGAADLIVTGYESTSQVFTLVPGSGTISPGKSLPFLVLFRPTVAGTFDGSISLLTNDPARPRLRIPVAAGAQQASVSRSVSLDVQAGDSGNRIPDGTRTVEIAGLGDRISIEVFVSAPPQKSFGGEVKLKYDRELFRTANVVVPEGFFVLAMTDTTIVIGSLGEREFPTTGFFARVVLEAKASPPASGTTVRVESLHLEFAFADVSAAEVQVRGRTTKTGDFDGDGLVGFGDFIQFAQRFGASQGSSSFDTRFDLDKNGSIGFGDFVLLAQNFGK
jgi:hypothetical protein